MVPVLTSSRPSAQAKRGLGFAKREPGDPIEAEVVEVFENSLAGIPNVPSCVLGEGQEPSITARVRQEAVPEEKWAAGLEVQRVDPAEREGIPEDAGRTSAVEP